MKSKGAKSSYSSKKSNVSPNHSGKQQSVDCDFYGAKDLQPHLRKIVKSTGGYTNA